LYPVSLAALVAFGLWAVLIEGPAMRSSAQERLNHEIAAENIVCEKFGMRSGTSEFLACSKELAIVRQKQADRDHAAELGLL
jgi:hypothetical protein